MSRKKNRRERQDFATDEAALLHYSEGLLQLLDDENVRRSLVADQGPQAELRFVLGAVRDALGEPTDQRDSMPDVEPEPEKKPRHPHWRVSMDFNIDQPTHVTVEREGLVVFQGIDYLGAKEKGLI